MMLQKDEIPAKYTSMNNDELRAIIDSSRKLLGDDLCILGHHYQSDAIVALADFVGDSLKLSQQSAQQAAKYIVFCGVHFMAESADILGAGEKTVILPNSMAGCSMANMAAAGAAESALASITSITGEKIVPITYVNSTAKIKALTGRYDGACCTSGNAEEIFKWALASKENGGGTADKLFCLPDQHLARNTAVRMGYSLDDCVVYDAAEPNGGLTEEQIKSAKFILWRGHCYVHQFFKPEDVQRVRDQWPEIQVAVHPECPYEVTSLADFVGSTEQIIKAVAQSPSGSKWAIATESNLVERIEANNPDKFVTLLSSAPAICVQMKLTDLAHLAWVLDELAQGNVVNQISVPSDIADEARLALERMIAAKMS